MADDFLTEPLLAPTAVHDLETPNTSTRTAQSVDLDLQFPPLANVIDCLQLSQHVILATRNTQDAKLDQYLFESKDGPSLTITYRGRNMDVGAHVIVATSTSRRCIYVAYGGSEDEGAVDDRDDAEEEQEEQAERILLNLKVSSMADYGPSSCVPAKSQGAVLDWSIPTSKEHGAVRVHYNFNRYVFDKSLHEYARNAIYTALDNGASLHEDRQPFRVVVTGYSMDGGAASQLFATYLAMEMSHTPQRSNPIVVINFGAPRVGNEAYREWVSSLENLAMWRFVYNQDVVCRVPPRVMGFRHVGNLVQLRRRQPQEFHDSTRTSSDIDDKEALCQAYYLQWGDPYRGFVGAPDAEWNSITDVSEGDAVLADHAWSNYFQHLAVSAKQEPETYYVTHFESEEESGADRWSGLYDSLLCWCV